MDGLISGSVAWAAIVIIDNYYGFLKIQLSQSLQKYIERTKEKLLQNCTMAFLKNGQDRAGSMGQIQCGHCSCKGPEFRFQPPHQEAHNPPGGSHVLFWPPGALHSGIHTHTETHIHISLKKKKNLLKNVQDQFFSWNGKHLSAVGEKILYITHNIVDCTTQLHIITKVLS